MHQRNDRPGRTPVLRHLHVYVAGLRKKLELDSQRPRYIITEPGVGYRFLGDPDGP